MSTTAVLAESSPTPPPLDYLAMAKASTQDPELATAYALIAVAETLDRLSRAVAPLIPTSSEEPTL